MPERTERLSKELSSSSSCPSVLKFCTNLLASKCHLYCSFRVYLRACLCFLSYSSANSFFAFCALDDLALVSSVKRSFARHSASCRLSAIVFSKGAFLDGLKLWGTAGMP